MKKTIQRKYARLIARVGAKIEKGQSVVIETQADRYEFITILVDECYKAGAKKVTVDWQYQPVTKLKYRHCPATTIGKVEPWEEQRLKDYSEKLPCRIYIMSEDPDGLNGINREKMLKAQQIRYKTVKPYRDAMDNKYQWCIAAVPSPEWARKVFPGERTSSAVEKLWRAILETVHVTEDNDPIEAWEEHNRKFAERSKILNDMHLSEIHYKSSNGTSFTAGLIPEAKWEGGGEYTLLGKYFNPNMPTEEIFTSPMAGKAEGTLVATKPLSYGGEIIDKFSITFKDGCAVSWTAEKGQTALDKMLSADEGARKLGELALVPYDSPINKQNILYFNTLFDENACCHVALGEGFTNLIDGYENKTKEELHSMGINDSMIHVDFMIGSRDLEIIGKNAAGKEYEIFKNGNFCF